MTPERTLVIFKPDAVKRKLVGRILQRFEDKDFMIRCMSARFLTYKELADHYIEFAREPFYHGLITSMQSGLSVLLVLEGHRVIAVVRRIIGYRDGAIAPVGTIRGDFASGDPISENLVHASASMNAAEREIRIFFPRFNTNLTLEDAET